MKKAKTSASSRTLPRSKQSPQQPQVMSNIENNLSFGNGVVANNNSIMTPPDNDYLANNNLHYTPKQQQHLLPNNHTNFANNNNTQPPPANHTSVQHNANNNGQSQQYVQINQGGQVHTMARQQPQYPQQQQQQQQRQDLNSRVRQDVMSTSQLETDRVALIQKNQRLAKELSDLRVKHREETKVVSRLTMENMNLASRCRQAISEAVDLKRKVVGYEKRHADFGNLQKEVLLLRRQIEKQHGGGGGGGGVQQSSSKRRNRSKSPKEVKRNNGANNDGSSNTPVDEKKKNKALASATSGSVTLETKGSSETTDLDRIMAQELFKKSGGAADSAAVVGGGSGVEGGNGGNAAEKKDGNANAVTKKFKDLSISTNTSASNSSKPGGGSKVSSSSTSTNNGTTSSKRTSQTTSSSSSSADNNNSSTSSTNTKIPISITSNNATQKDEDEFDAEIDMVGFFAKSSKTTLGTSSSSANNGSESDAPPPPPSHHTRSHITHKMKKTETDDHMPEELVSSELLSPSGGTKKNVGDNLLSSLDAFEASFASAFPETSFSLKSEAPSSTQLDMSFDVPVFDPFFKSPVNKDSGGAAESTPLQSSSPKSKSASSSGVGGSGTNHNKDGMKSQLKDLFPDSALTTSPKRGLDLTFDSTFSGVDIGGVGVGGSSSNNNRSGKKSLSADKLDSAFSRAHATTSLSSTTTPLSKVSISGKSTSSRATPLDMSAEIEQLDALASAPEKVEGGERKRSVRKVKTPLSYAEPSISQKLRRGDVLFPKIDADRKLELEAKRSKSGGAGAISPTTDLDRIMSEFSSVNSNNKKDGTVPS